MEPITSDVKSPSKIADLEKFYLKCLKNGSYVETEEE